MESTISTSGASAATDSSRSPRLVSGITNSRSLCTSSRLARSFSWCSDSSPDTYRTLFSRQNCSRRSEASAWTFPIPGAPPTSTSEPLTAPPPRTRSSSPMPVENRFPHPPPAPSPAGPYGRSPPAGREAPFPAARAAWGCSTMVFHAPQAGTSPPTWASHCCTPCSRTGSLASLQPPMERERNKLSDLFSFNAYLNSARPPRWPPPALSGRPGPSAVPSPRRWREIRTPPARRGG